MYYKQFIKSDYYTCYADSIRLYNIKDHRLYYCPCKIPDEKQFEQCECVKNNIHYNNYKIIDTVYGTKMILYHLMYYFNKTFLLWWDPEMYGDITFEERYYTLHFLRHLRKYFRNYILLENIV